MIHILWVFFCFLLVSVAAEDGLSGWLRYAPFTGANSSQFSLPSIIVPLNRTKTSPVYTAALELQKGFQGIFGKNVSIGSAYSNSTSSVIVGTLDSYGNTSNVPALDPDGFWLNNNGNSVEILGSNERGGLYGAFEYLSMIAQGNFSKVAYATNPSAPIRFTNEWTNLPGNIERGYGGASFLFSEDVVVSNLTRASEYARLLASIRINGVIVNNVNANASILTTQNIEGLGRIADTFRPYGVQLGISLNFASPQLIGGLDTFDPLNEEVIDFWGSVTDQIYQRIPDMAGYLVKANSEGQPGPLTYNRTLADGANLFAKAVEPYKGVVMFRAFVYDLLNISDWKADRANAAVEFFQDLDGKFADNVIIQSKFGPIDFQVREPASPLFANLPHTNIAIELQITQEYLGQQCHLVYVPPLWKTVLDFDLQVDNQPSLVRNIISGKRFNRPLGGSAGVVNAGTNTTWLGSHLAMSNLYAYGRLAWDPSDEPKSILQDWIRLTFSLDPDVINTITNMSLASWPAYESYTGNLGMQGLTQLLGPHMGPDANSANENSYGQWTRADSMGVGMDRTQRNGTGNAGQYPPAVAEVYENIETTPDDLLLWFHHVNYTQPLRQTNETVIQHIYNAHYSGAATAQTFPTQWSTLQSKIDTERYDEVLFRLNYQAGHSLVWRDAIVNYFNNISAIPDEAARVGNHPYRIEAESMTLSGYKLYSVKPGETASNRAAIVTADNSTVGTASATIPFASGTYNLAINYFDLIGGRSTYEVSINDRVVGHWTGNSEDRLGHTPSPYLDGTSAIRITFPQSVEISTGDVLRITGTPDGIEPAPIDYVSLLPEGVVD